MPLKKWQHAVARPTNRQVKKRREKRCGWGLKLLYKQM
jgi:hypothetical protein